MHPKSFGTFEKQVPDLKKIDIVQNFSKFQELTTEITS